jgi:hypothetical protein
MRVTARACIRHLLRDSVALSWRHAATNFQKCGSRFRPPAASVWLREFKNTRSIVDRMFLQDDAGAAITPLFGIDKNRLLTLS